MTRNGHLPEHGFDDGGGRYVEAGDDRHRLEDEGGDGRLLSGELLHQLVKLPGVRLPLLFGSYSVVCRSWVTQKLPQICTVILSICIGKVA